MSEDVYHGIVFVLLMGILYLLFNLGHIVANIADSVRDRKR